MLWLTGDTLYVAEIIGETNALNVQMLFVKKLGHVKVQINTRRKKNAESARAMIRGEYCVYYSGCLSMRSY